MVYIYTNTLNRGDTMADLILLLLLPLNLYVLTKGSRLLSHFLLIASFLLVLFQINSLLSTVAMMFSLICSYFIVLKWADKIEKNHKQEVEELLNNSLTTQENIFFKDILTVSSEKEPLNISASKLCSFVQNYYRINYISLFIKNTRNGLEVAATNVEKDYIQELTQYVIEKYNLILNGDDVARILCSDSDLDYPSAQKRKIKYLYIIPLGAADNEIGALVLEDTKRDNLEKYDGNLFKIIVEGLTLTLQNLIYSDRLIQSKNIDGMTQVFNRNYFDTYVPRYIELCERTNEIFSLAMCDIDHFKKINDSYGHLAGDFVLKEVTRTLKDKFRSDMDVIFRYGGEEFILLFKNTSLNKIFDRLDEIRESLAGQIIKYNDQEINVTMSFGLAQYPEHGTTLNSIIKAADNALYYSKQNGRNKITDFNLLLSSGPIKEDLSEEFKGAL